MIRLVLPLLLASMSLPAAAGQPDLPSIPHLATPAPGVLSAGRIGPDDVPRLAGAGVRGVIDLTVDAETPDFDEAAAVRAAGLGYENLPIAGPADLTRANVEAFDRLLAGAERPVFVHCASSNRVGALAALRAVWLQGMPVEDAIAEGRRWGLGSLEGAVRERLAP